MSRTLGTPQAQAGDARVSEAHDLAGPDGDDEIDATDDRERRCYFRTPADVPLPPARRCCLALHDTLLLTQPYFLRCGRLHDRRDL
jgi:hypothetical protein